MPVFRKSALKGVRRALGIGRAVRRLPRKGITRPKRKFNYLPKKIKGTRRSIIRTSTPRDLM